MDTEDGESEMARGILFIATTAARQAGAASPPDVDEETAVNQAVVLAAARTHLPLLQFGGLAVVQLQPSTDDGSGAAGTSSSSGCDSAS